MRTISNWRARRSGGRMTITGIDARFDPVKLTEVDSIALNERGEVVAYKDAPGNKILAPLPPTPVAILAMERLRYHAAGDLDRSLKAD